MKGIAVRPGEPGSLHLADLPEPEAGTGDIKRVIEISGTD